MTESTYRVFLHALRADGSISSICRHCLMVVAIELNEIDLCEPEHAHVCSNLDLRVLFHPEEARLKQKAWS